MDAITYYREQFRFDLATVAAGSDWISFVSLQGQSPGKYGNQTCEAFRELEPKCLFLFCYFYCVLLDQAVHTGANEEHRSFNAYWECPKFRGILGSAHSNLHPGLILEIATKYVSEENEEKLGTQLNSLASFFATEFRRILTEDYPKAAGRLKSDSSRQAFCESVLRAAEHGLVFSTVPGAFGGLSEEASEKDRHYTDWLWVAGKALNSTNGL